jgi:uncharacterized cysteine cluster protein YcgN (CxxCxxCC family)
MEPFWSTTTLAAMSRDQWESLCDGCAKCCLQKLEDVETRAIFYTDVACRLLDLDTCRCSDYPHRSRRVPTCVTLTLKDLKDPYWLPSTCAYRLLAEGRPLPPWHPLISGDPDTVASAGHSVRGRVTREAEGIALEHRLIDWVR